MLATLTRRALKLGAIVMSGDYAWLRALRLGVAASTEHVRMLRGLTCRTVVDIGANRGQFALVARHCWPDAVIHSFEPLPRPAGVFRTIFGAEAKVRLFESAIGIEAGTERMHVSRRDDSSSLLPITETQARLFPGTAEAGTQEVTVGRLGEYLSAEEIASPALLKLDVQGYELEALRGCVEVLPRFDYVYAECSFVEFYEGQALADEVISWLRHRGFRLVGCYNLVYDRSGLAMQGDLLFGVDSAAKRNKSEV